MDKPEPVCCPPGSWPALVKGCVSKGERINIGNTDCYHIGDSNKVLILIEDIFGNRSGRHETVADTFASFGYNVYMPSILINPYPEDAIDMKNMMDNIKGQNWEQM